jgi:hypothetical protein
LEEFGEVHVHILCCSAPLDSAAPLADNPGMETLGHVCNGVVVLEGGVTLPEGTLVTVSCDLEPASPPTSKKERVRLPLVRTGEPGSLHLTNERIAEILDEEDVASSRR